MHTELWFGHYLSEIELCCMDISAWYLTPFSEEVESLHNVVDSCIDDASIEKVIAAHALLHGLDPCVKFMAVRAVSRAERLPRVLRFGHSGLLCIEGCKIGH